MPKTILLVDDAAVIRQLGALTLKKEGYTVIDAVNGKDALDKTAGATFDMIITDLNMPEMDGIELIRQIRSREQFKFTPILMLTTESQEQKKLEGKAAGASGWILKPFNPKQLLEMVKKFIG